VLVFDTETTTALGQALLFGCARVYRWDRVGLTLLEESLFYADDLEARDAAGYQSLTRHADRVGLPLRSRRAFLAEVFWPTAHRARGWVVGFNLPFDLARLATTWGAARLEAGRAFSLVLWDYWDATRGQWREDRYRARVQILHIDPKRSLISFARRFAPDREDLIPEGSPTGCPEDGYRFPGHFLDLRALLFALTNEGHSLGTACQALGVEHSKQEAPSHGLITPAYIDYCRRDVLATAEVFERALIEHERHPIGLSPTKALSPAAMAKSYLDAMGVKPPLTRQPDFPLGLLGFGMAAYIGGRVEVRLRRMPVPVAVLDFRSMYPTVNALMRLWRFMTAERVEAIDATETARRLVRQITLDECFDPTRWPELVVLCRVRANGEILPARARYGGAAWQVGVNPLTASEPLWLPLADIVAAKLLGGQGPEILEAVRLVPVGVQPGLRPIRLGGEIKIDPYRDDFFARLVEERARLTARTDLDAATRKRLDSALKCVANAGSYGISAEMTRHHLGAGGERVSVYALNEPFTVPLTDVEDPGRFCFPPLAACITAGARLMLALLERCITDADGTHVYGDTDSMAVVATPRDGLVRCPGGPLKAGKSEAVKALTFDQVEQIVRRFARLSPYEPDAVPGSILRIEHADVTEAGQTQLYAFAISAKRYCLFTLDAHGEPSLVKPSKHGLGHLLNPIDPSASADGWIGELWMLILNQALGRDHTEPDWLDRPALTRVTISSPSLLRPFAAHNERRPPHEQLRPFSFLMYAQVVPFGHPAGADPARFRLVAPYDRDPDHWEDLEWIDLNTSRPYPITTTGSPSPTAVRVKTYRDVADLYGRHPEPKSRDHTGRPCSRRSQGLLLRRPITASVIRLIGKESNSLDSTTTGLVGDLDLVLMTYADPALDPWGTLVLPTLATFATRILADLANVDQRTIQRILRGTTPRRDLAARLTLIARDLARLELQALGLTAPADPLACLRYHLDTIGIEAARHSCAECGVPLDRPRARYCSHGCK
jgi:hypothetical protein